MLAVAAMIASMTLMDDALTIGASVQTSAIEVSKTFTVDVSMDAGVGWQADAAGLPGYVVQLDVPDSVQPVGEVLTDLRQLARNGLMLAPYERMVEGDEASIEFTLIGDPDDADSIAFNVLAYMAHDDGRTVFTRRRVELPVRAGASAKASQQATTSDWGLDAAGVQIGEPAPDVSLPTKDGEMVSLGARFDESDVILTTYRAFW